VFLSVKSTSLSPSVMNCEHKKESFWFGIASLLTIKKSSDLNPCSTPTMASDPTSPNDEEALSAAAYASVPVGNQPPDLPSPSTARKTVAPRQTDHTYHDWAKHPPDDYAIRSSKKAENNFVSSR
jgi:hypothetical protein